MVVLNHTSLYLKEVVMADKWDFYEINDRLTDVFPFYVYTLYGNPGPLVPPHWHNEHEIIIPKHPGRLLLDGKEYTFENGDLMWVNPKQIHSTYLNFGGMEYHILISPKLLDISANEYSLSCPRIVSKITSAPQRYMQITDELVSYTTPVGKDDIYKIMSRLYELLTMLIDDKYYVIEYESSDNIYTDYIKNAIKYIEDNITDKISINDVAGTIGISGAHLMRLFKKYTGFTIITYITTLKLEHALLDIQSGAGIADVAYKYSFTDAAYFCRKFKDRYKMSPHRYCTDSKN